MEKRVTAVQARRAFRKILRDVEENGLSYIVTWHGKPVMRIEPIPNSPVGGESVLKLTTLEIEHHFGISNRVDGHRQSRSD
jgi:prevent-host-death family protein